MTDTNKAPWELPENDPVNREFDKCIRIKALETMIKVLDRKIDKLLYGEQK